jgi:hypothetical protein
MLFDPLEKQLHVPSVPIPTCDAHRWPREGVGAEGDCLLGGVEELIALAVGFFVSRLGVRAIEEL